MKKNDRPKLKKIKIQSQSYYDKNSKEEKDYVYYQTNRWASKKSAKRCKSFYEKVVSSMEYLVNCPKDAKLNMICLGARNNWERDTLKLLIVEKLKISNDDLNVFSCDIAVNKRQACDFIEDFNDLPKGWNNKWDIVYSNSIDHAIDATETFYKWVDLLRQKASLLIIGFDTNNYTPTRTDACVFTQESIQAFFNKQEEIEVLKIKNVEGYIHYFLKRG